MTPRFDMENLQRDKKTTSLQAIMSIYYKEKPTDYKVLPNLSVLILPKLLD